MRFSLNTIGLFPGLSFEQIFPRMRQSGFDTFELWSLENVDTAALRQAMDRHGVRLSAFCPSFFVLNDPARQEEYIASLRRALALAQELSCPALITQVGQDTGAPPGAAARGDPFGPAARGAAAGGSRRDAAG